MDIQTVATGQRQCPNVIAERKAELDSRPERLLRLRISHPDRVSEYLMVEIMAKDIKDAAEKAWKFVNFSLPFEKKRKQERGYSLS